MKKKLYLGLAAILISFASWFVGQGAELGGVARTQAYVSTTTRSTSASGTYSYPACLGSGTFGSIVVVQPATAGYVQVHDATSTATSTYQTTSLAASTLTFGKPIAKVLSASDVVGTLAFDAVFYKGVLVETSGGFDGEYVLTCRN